jgi:uncharacterized protein with HEPN domain
MKKDDSVYLEHILISIIDIERFIKDLNFENFVTDYKLQLAVFRLVEIIGEASTKISGQLKDRYPENPWVDIRGIRNRLVHDYFNIRIEVIWKALNEDIPKLKSQIRKILEDNFPQILLNYE